MYRSEPLLQRSLPGPYYTSHAMLATEKERILSKSWLCVGRVDSLAKAGQAICVEVADESVLIVRDRLDSLHGFFNVCRHRGTRLCTEESAEFRSAIPASPANAEKELSWTAGMDTDLPQTPGMDREWNTRRATTH